MPVPKTMGDAAGLIVMGGPMGVYDHPRYPFLSDEMRLIEQALKEEKPILGVCLGSQLLAAALGGAVAPGKRKEIGWHPVQLTQEAQTDRLWKGIEPVFTAYHWHGDLFQLPEGAVPLARSEQTEHQAFRYGPHAYGFLFHMEVTRKIIGEMVETFSEELKECRIDRREIVGKVEDHLPRLQKIGGVVFERWAKSIPK
ncbi:MAG: gamma-glutamyl-gamma-aminobutyrate hydrolase family protein [Candidatus Manganitrophus sp.]|nr:MAG: gamma-glutamyl-gamma-aminobutyrate hydrolase family protein [Candidatus Manganitrophus sp.]